MLSNTDVAPRYGVKATSQNEVYRQGIVAGTLGATTIAIWFLTVDLAHGRPLYTPTVLGTALFRGGQGLESPDSLPIAFDMVLVVTWLHFLIFAFVGGVASRLLMVVEQQPDLGFGIVLFFVVFECGFIVAAMAFAQPVLHALNWVAILVGNLLAAAVMALYFWRRHPNLQILP